MHPTRSPHRSRLLAWLIAISVLPIVGLGSSVSRDGAAWRVRSGHHPDSPWRYDFPIVAIWSGVLLLAHVHEVSDSKSAFFMELSHLPLGLASLLAGWARWLELRLPPAESGRSRRIWGPAPAVFGLLLILHREG